MKFSLLIVNYNTESYIEALIYSLLEQTISKLDFEIIISNNVQNKNLEEMISKNNFYDVIDIKVVQIDKNIGFGRATNAAAELANGAHLLIINPDVLMTDNNYLSSMYQFIIRNQDYGVISSKILGDSGFDMCEHYDYEFSESFGYTNEICWFSGSLLFIRKDLFKEIDGFDDDYFMFCEDVDICYRIKKQGLPLIKNEELSVYHKVGASEPVREHDFYRRWCKSRILFMHKHYNNNKFNEFINDLYKRQKLLSIRYTILDAIFPTDRYKMVAIEHQIMFETVKKTINSSTEHLY
ncbi:hypothetical protein PSYCG_03465 [Psychrobacter sp. G]|uniref:glycosyltransferase family 2 protein n=1 Tax=Psychrobacter sp. G TaxID=571800 RepID=UPI000354E669|nr:glycosyltransferase family 2 protein [Psychrobacter sp. G]AGP48231.1 hypothetical protein PSYCG_03465 [Psychrobacter sp. G]